MRLSLLSAVGAVVLALAALAPASAQRVEYKAHNDITSIVGDAPTTIIWGDDVYLTFVFDLATPATSVSPTSVTYKGIYGIAELRSGYVGLLYNVTLTITKDPAHGFFYYVFWGTSANGWTFLHASSAQYPDFVPSFALPTTAPVQRQEPEFFIDGDISIIGPEREWAASCIMGDPFSVRLLPAAADVLSIAKQPESVTVKLGKHAKFQVRASSDTDVSYQWLKDGLPIIGENAKSLRLDHVTAADAGTYRVLVGNGVDFVLSDPATLTVY